jgi:hypothetical protein
VHNVSLFYPPLDAQPFQSLQVSAKGELLQQPAHAGRYTGRTAPLHLQHSAGPYVTLMAAFTNSSTQQESLVLLDPTEPVELYFADLYGLPLGSVRFQFKLPSARARPISRSLCTHGDRLSPMDEIDRLYAVSLRTGALLSNMSRVMPDDQMTSSKS